MHEAAEFSLEAILMVRSLALEKGASQHFAPSGQVAFLYLSGPQSALWFGTPPRAPHMEHKLLPPFQEII